MPVYPFHPFVSCPVQHLWSFLQATIYLLTVYYNCTQRALTFLFSSYQYCETLQKTYLLSQIHHCTSLGLWHWCQKEARINQPNRSHVFLFNLVPQWVCFFSLLLCFLVQKAPSKMTLDIYVNTALFWLYAFQSIYFTSFKRHQGKKIACMLTQFCTVRSCRMAVQAVSGVLTQLLWGVHTNALFHCLILYAQAMWPLAFSGAFKGTAEWEKNCLSRWVCPLSANWVLGWLCALSFNIVPACRRRRVAGTVHRGRLRVMLVQFIGEASPEEEERLFTMGDCRSHRKPVHTYSSYAYSYAYCRDINST